MADMICHKVYEFLMSILSLYKSLNILKEQYNWNLFMNIKYFFLKKFKARHNNNYHNYNKLFFCCKVKNFLIIYLSSTFGGVFRRLAEKNIADW
jgi:hypothetical protein